MPLESVTHISDLVVTNPTSTDPKSEGDNHLRNIKTALKTDFPNISGPVTKTHTQLNNALDKTGDTMTGALLAALGSASAPGVAFDGDTNTGIYSPGADQVSVATGGVQRLSVDASGNVLSRSGPLGYGVGAGGTVTQATSKSTLVPLNKPSGHITMNNAALAAGSSATFTLVNSFITDTDGVLINLAGGMLNANSYRIGWYVGNTGSVLITLTNQFGSSLSEAVVLSFQVIKGATS